MLDKYPKDVKLVTKHFPLANHKFARQAATAALAAGKQGKFWEFHDKIFENSKSLSDSKVQEIAKELKLDEAQFSKDLKDPAIQKLIGRDMNNGLQAGVRGTPTIFVNGKLLQKRNMQGFQEMIEAELQKKK